VCAAAALPGARFVGCFKNDANSQRLIGHATDKSFSDCEQAAKAAGKPYFGMEYPQGFATPGHAECLLLDAVPQQSKTADSECAREKDIAGNLLGDANRLAVYTMQPGVSSTLLPLYRYRHVTSRPPCLQPPRCKRLQLKLYCPCHLVTTMLILQPPRCKQLLSMSVSAPSQPTITWRVANAGSSTWQPGVQVVAYSDTDCTRRVAATFKACSRCAAQPRSYRETALFLSNRGKQCLNQRNVW